MALIAFGLWVDSQNARPSQLTPNSVSLKKTWLPTQVRVVLVPTDIWVATGSTVVVRPTSILAVWTPLTVVTW